MAELADPSGTPPAGGTSGEHESEAFRAENLRLKQELAHLKGLNAKAAPVVTAVMRLAQSGDEGKVIVEKLLRGEPLTPSQERAAAEEAKGYLTREELMQVLDGELTPKIAEAIEERLYIADSAKESRKELDSWASKEHGELYDSLKSSTPFKRKLLKNHEELEDGVNRGLYEIPSKYKGDDVDRVFKWAIDQTLAQVKADNPNLGKKTKVEKTPQEREAEKISVSTRGSGSSGETNEIPEELREEIASIRRIGTRSTIGKSWGRRETAAGK